MSILSLQKALYIYFSLSKPLKALCFISTAQQGDDYEMLNIYRQYLKEYKPQIFKCIMSGANFNLATLKYDKAKRLIELMASMSPYVGLVGTISSLSIAMSDIEPTNTNDLIPVIGEAIYATGAGIVVAIIAILLASLSNERINRLQILLNESRSNMASILANGI